VGIVVADPERYQSFLLRLWRETPDLPWRYQIRCVSTGAEYRFSDLEQVQAFLRDVATGGNGPDRACGGRSEDASSRQRSASNRLDLAYV